MSRFPFERLKSAVPPDILLTLGAVAISFSGVWVSIAAVPPATSAFYRVFFGAIFLLVITLLAGEKLMPSGRDLLLGTLCGIVFALDLIFWHSSILLVGPGLATILGNFQVFILAAAGILFLGERYSALFFLAVPLAVAGLFLILGIDWQAMPPGYRLGLLYGLATAVCYAAYILSLRRLAQRSEATFQPMLLVSLTTTAVLFGYVAFSGGSLALPGTVAVTSLAGLGLFSQCLGWVFIAVSLPKTNASRAGLLLLLQPALAFVWDVLIFHRPTTAANWLGVCVTLGAIHLGMHSRQGSGSS